MNPVLKNILALIAGVVIGGIVNMALIMVGPSIIPNPEGVDPADVNSIAANMHLYSPKHFIMPFLAHAIGTLVGALVAAKIAANNKMRFALLVGLVFLIGGIMAAFLLPGPLWFEALDILLAYLPMGWLGWKLAGADPA